MVTSLGNFRSDYTIVPVPSGVFLEARDLLYININLLRMGCSGRMALTLQEPRRAQFQKSVSSAEGMTLFTQGRYQRPLHQHVSHE
jgi:hypothetical protein